MVRDVLRSSEAGDKSNRVGGCTGVKGPRRVEKKGSNTREALSTLRRRAVLEGEKKNTVTAQPGAEQRDVKEEEGGSPV